MQNTEEDEETPKIAIFLLGSSEAFKPWAEKYKILKEKNRLPSYTDEGLGEGGWLATRPLWEIISLDAIEAKYSQFAEEGWTKEDYPEIFDKALRSNIEKGHNFIGDLNGLDKDALERQLRRLDGSWVKVAVTDSGREIDETLFDLVLEMKDTELVTRGITEKGRRYGREVPPRRNRILIVSGNPGAGKTTFIERETGASEGSLKNGTLTDEVQEGLFDDAKRLGILKKLRSLQLGKYEVLKKGIMREGTFYCDRDWYLRNRFPDKPGDTVGAEEFQAVLDAIREEYINTIMKYGFDQDRGRGFNEVILEWGGLDIQKSQPKEEGKKKENEEDEKPMIKEQLRQWLESIPHNKERSVEVNLYFSRDIPASIARVHSREFPDGKGERDSVDRRSEIYMTIHHNLPLQLELYRGLSSEFDIHLTLYETVMEEGTLIRNKVATVEKGEIAVQPGQEEAFAYFKLKEFINPEASVSTEWMDDLNRYESRVNQEKLFNGKIREIKGEIFSHYPQGTRKPNLEDMMAVAAGNAQSRQRY